MQIRSHRPLFAFWTVLSSPHTMDELADLGDASKSVKCFLGD